MERKFSILFYNRKFFSRDNGDIIIRAPYLPEENGNLSLGDLLLNVGNEVTSSGIVPL